LEGVVVVDKTGRVFVPLQAVYAIAGTGNPLPGVVTSGAGPE
jgi:hypothetical protein